MQKQVYNFSRFKVVFFLFRKKIYSIIKFIFWKIFDFFIKSSFLLKPFLGNYLIKYLIKVIKLIKKILDFCGFNFLIKRLVTRYFNIKNQNKYPNNSLATQINPEINNINHIDYESRLISISSTPNIKKIHEDLIHRLSTRDD